MILMKDISLCVAAFDEESRQIRTHTMRDLGSLTELNIRRATILLSSSFTYPTSADLCVLLVSK